MHLLRSCESWLERGMIHTNQSLLSKTDLSVTRLSGPEINTSHSTSEEICRFRRDLVGIYTAEVINIAEFWGCFWHLYILSVFSSSCEGLQTCDEETGGGWIYTILLVWIRAWLSHAPLHCSRSRIVHQQKKEQWHCWPFFSFLFANG